MKKFLNKFNIYHLEIIFLLIVGLVPLLWYKDGYIAFGHDMGFPLAPVGHFLDRLYTWTDRLGPFGSNAVQVLPGFFIHGLEALLYSVGFSLLAVQKMTYVFWFVLPGITMYILLRYLHPKEENFPLRVSGSLFYMMNHYLLQGWTIAERTKFSIVAALPLVVLLIIEVLHKRQSPVRNSILLALTLFFLNGGEGIPLLISLLIVVVVVTITFFFLSSESFWSKTKRLFIFSLLSSLFWVLLSSYWLFPYLTSYNQTFGQRFDEAAGTAGILSWSQGISVNTSWINLFKLRGMPDWYNIDHPFAKVFFGNPFLLFLNLLFPSIALAGFLNLKNVKGLLLKVRVCFLGLLLIAIPLSAGSHYPLGIFYDYLLVNVPGFAMFRSGFFKFGMIIWFAYAYLIAIGLQEIINWLRTRSTGELKRYMAVGVLSIYIIVTFIYNYPLLTGLFFNWGIGKSTMVNVPNYVLESKKELDNDKFFTRTLLIPNSDLRTEYIEYDWKYFSLVVLQNSLSRNSFVINSVLTRSEERSLTNAMLSEYTRFGQSNLVKFTGIDRAIVQNDFVSPDYEGNPLSGIIDSFKKSTDITYKKTLGKWDLYSYNQENLPLVYSPSKLTFVSSLENDLDLVANLSGALEGDGFVWSKYPEDSSEGNIFERIIIQANCADCLLPNNYQIYFSTSKILVPGTVFYNLNKFITNVKKDLTSSPNAKLEMNLALSTSLTSDLGVLQAKSDAKGVKVAVEDLSQNLKEMKSNLAAIPDSNLKKEIIKKVRFFVAFFLYYETQWATSAQLGPVKSDLVILESELKKTVADLDGEIGQVKVDADDKLYQYTLSLPRTGNYNLYFYSPNLLENTKAIAVGDQQLNAIKLNQNWYKIAGVPLEKSEILVKMIKNLDSKERPAVFAELVLNSPNLVSPNIEFVALNQTKYLIRTQGSGEFVLGFNSRFDPGWSLREVDTHVANNYFKGEKKKFTKANVIEYEKGDVHLITDLIFPKNKTKVLPTIQLNGFSSGWVLNSTNTSSKKTFLLEYGSQNGFYEAAAVSLATLIFISILYFIRYAKKEH